MVEFICNTSPYQPLLTTLNADGQERRGIANWTRVHRWSVEAKLSNEARQTKQTEGYERDKWNEKWSNFSARNMRKNPARLIEQKGNGGIWTRDLWVSSQPPYQFCHGSWTTVSAQCAKLHMNKPNIVYFDQRLGAAHSKRWSKKSFSAFFLHKS